jgi:RHS repeat-associated protein
LNRRLHLLSETAQFTGGATPGQPYDYVWFGDRPVAQVDPTGTHWTYSDHLGTPLIQTDTNGTVTWQAEYEPYGSVYALRAGDVHQPLRLPGQSAEQFDMSANGFSPLSYNNARWYQSTWGQYTQPDPLGLALSGSNLFPYAGNDPTDWTDPSGLCLVQVFYHQINDADGLFNFASHGNIRVTENSSGAPDYYGNGQGDEGSVMYDAEPTGAGGSGNLHEWVVPWFGTTYPAPDVRAAIYGGGTSAARRGPFTIVNDSLPCTCEKNALQSTADKINNADIPYFGDPDMADQDVFGNSNGALYELLNSLGAAGNAPPGGATAPGYGPLNYTHTVNPIGVDGSF